MTTPDSRHRLAPARRRRRGTARRSKAFLAELRRQCRLANNADLRDDWQKFLHLPS